MNEFLSKMKSTTSSNQKVKILQEYKNDTYIINVLKYTYDPFKQYHITTSTLDKHHSLKDVPQSRDIFELLDLLNNRILTGNNAIKEVNGFVQKYPNLKYLLYLILDRNLKVRVSVNLINKSIPDLIPTFNVSLAHRFDKKRFDLQKSEWYVSRKLDGVRCICVIEKGKSVKMYSRSGKEFNTLGNVIKEVEKINFQNNVVLDGEICMIDSDEKDHFQDIMKEIRRKNHTIPTSRVSFFVFDIISLDDFLVRKSKKTFKERLCDLQDLFKRFTFNTLRMVTQHKMNTLEGVLSYFQQGKTLNWEGLILRKNTVYEGKRTWNMMKMKDFYEDEYDVMSVHSDTMRYVQGGKEKEERMVSSITIKHKGNLIQVGSGFTIKERQYFHKYPQELMSSKVTVKYFEETLDNEGRVKSLRFPTIKTIHRSGIRTM